MKVNEAPEKIYIFDNPILDFTRLSIRQSSDDVEYTRTDAFIEKAEKWFEIQNEGVDFDGNYKCDMTDFEDFVKYMKGE